MNIHVLTVSEIENILVKKDEADNLKVYGSTYSEFSSLVSQNSFKNMICYVYAEEDGIFLSRMVLKPEVILINGLDTQVFWAGKLTKNIDVHANFSPAIIMLKAIEVTGGNLLVASYSKMATPMYNKMKKARMFHPFYKRTLSTFFIKFDVSLLIRKIAFFRYLHPVLSLLLGILNTINKLILFSIIKKYHDDMVLIFEDNLQNEIIKFIDVGLSRDLSNRNGHFFQELTKLYGKKVRTQPPSYFMNNKTGFSVTLHNKITNEPLMFAYCIVSDRIIKLKYIVGSEKEKEACLRNLLCNLVSLAIQKKLLGIEVSSDVERKVISKILKGSFFYIHNREKECLSTMEIDETRYDFQAGIGDNIAF
ncbi:MAG: hypothetical protein K9J13_00620 [Saprospiraceae bacterium]|nr:hypothetical protein [Saprospiraceae bacterium]